MTVTMRVATLLAILSLVFKCSNSEPWVLSQENYAYNLAMDIPQGFDVTTLLPISAYDGDFANKNVYFSIEANEDFKLGYEGKTVSNKKGCFTSLTALKNISAPYRREFTLIATDAGNPQRSTTAKITVRVTSNSAEFAENESAKSVAHPPTFGKYLYLATYTSNHELKLAEPIIVKYGADTIIRQSGFTDYFKIQTTGTGSTEARLQVETLKQPPNTLLGTDLIVIEIEAENPGLSVSGRTALVIRLPQNKEDDSHEGSEESPDECDPINIWGLNYNHVVFPVVFCLISITIIVFLNVIIVALCFRRHKKNAVPDVEPTVVVANSP